MSLAYLEYDQWDDRSDNNVTIPNPSWEEVESAILALDGNVFTLVKVAFDEEAYMMVAGGGGEGYIVFASVGNRGFSQLTDPSKPIGKIVMDVGGQPGEYPARHCVPFEMAVVAAKAYAKGGQLASELLWETS